MIKIGLCDDEKIYIEQLSRIIQSIANDNKLEISLTTFNSGDELLEFGDKHKGYFDILFLDILMKGKNGIEVAKTIRSVSDNEYIIFATSSKEYALDGYSVNAYGYILKPFSYESIEKVLLEINDKIESRRKNAIYVKNNQDIYSLMLDNVVYFESNLRKITAHLIDGETVSFYNKMSNLEKDIDSSVFVRCHRSFLINMIYLKNIVGYDIITTTNEHIPISKKYLSKTRDSFTGFIRFKLCGN